MEASTKNNVEHINVSPQHNGENIKVLFQGAGGFELTKEERDCIVLAAGCRNMREVARSLGINVASVYSRLHAACVKMRTDNQRLVVLKTLMKRLIHE